MNSDSCDCIAWCVLLSDVYTRVPVSHTCMQYRYAVHVAIMFTRAYRYAIQVLRTSTQYRYAIHVSSLFTRAYRYYVPVRNTGTQYMLQLCLHVRTGIAYMYAHAYH